MRWNQFANEPARASLLGEVLLAAATAGGVLTETKAAVVHGQVAKALGATVIPAEVLTHLGTFDPRRFDLHQACAALALETPRERLDLMKAISVVITADTIVLPEERAFALRVATELGLPWNEVIGLVGMPTRPSTGPRPRPVPRH